MNKYILTVSFLLIPLYICTQETKKSDFTKLPFLPGKVETYYSIGNEARAKYLQELVVDAVTFYQNKLKDTFNIKLLVLNRNDYRSLIGTDYPFPVVEFDPCRIVMVVPEIYKIKLPDNKTLYGKNIAFFWDFIAIHELGHYISAHRNTKTITRWAGEFFADYIQIGFLIEKIPDWHPSPLISITFH